MGCGSTISIKKTHPPPRMKNGVDREEMLKKETVTASGLAYWVRTLEEEGIGYDKGIRRDIAIALLTQGFQSSGHLNGARTKDWLHRPLEEHVEDRLDAICYKIEKREKQRMTYKITEKEDREGTTAGCKEIKELLQGMLRNNVQSADKTPLAMIRATAAGCLSNEDKAVTVLVHRHQALCGGLSETSVKKYIASLNCWEQFATTIGGHLPGKELPPSVDGLAAWSRMFSIRRTFGDTWLT